MWPAFILVQGIVNVERDNTLHEDSHFAKRAFAMLLREYARER